MVRDYLDRVLLDIATLYRDVLLTQSGEKGELINNDMTQVITDLAARHESVATVAKLQAIMESRENLARNAAPLLTVEGLMLQLK